MESTRARLARIWPQFGLEITTPRLRLRIGDDDDLVDLALLAEGGVHDPAVMPFTTPWTDVPPPGRERGTLGWHWQARAECRPESWSLQFVVLAGDEVIGSQAVVATGFPDRREVSSGSWLGIAHQGRGYGREMRAAVLHLAFDHLGARRARSGAFLDNHASAAVSRALGYHPDGTESHVVRGECRVAQRFLLEYEQWDPEHARGSTVRGVDGVRPLLGA